MPCINPNSPEFKEALEKTGNPLLAEIEMSNLILKNQDTFYQQNNGESIEHKVASEKTIRDLAARMSDRIGIPVKFESDRTKEYKGKLDKGTVDEYGYNHEQTVAVVNLAYATLDTPIHEILGHPIIRVIKGTNNSIKWSNIIVGKNEDFDGYYISYTNAETGVEKEIFTFEDEVSVLKYKQNLEKENSNYSGNRQLYQNLLKELEYGKGKEVLDRVKKDYNNKHDYSIIEKYGVFQVSSPTKGTLGGFNTIEEAQKELDKLPKYTLEEQQEEAIVELLGLYTADRLDKVKDGKLISLIKRLLKEIKSFVRDLLKQREVEIEKLPDNMTLGDIADLLAYSNSKLILPGNEVIYTTPDNQQFKTYAEASKHISDLAKSVEDVDLNSINIKKYAKTIDDVPAKFNVINETDVVYKENGKWFRTYPTMGFNKESLDDLSNDDIIEMYNKTFIYKQEGYLQEFIKRNKEYEQAKEIIEEWKKVNNIQYNPEEVYSRGQEFVSVVGAYSDFDVNLMMQNLLQHIEDNQKAGGEFTISAFTKPIDRKIGHLEGGGGKIKFKIYPQSQDIKWAANTDVYSGSVWDASKKVSKDKKSELLGVSYTKYPSLQNVYSVQPNLASIIDNLAHHHNELGISLTGNNFRLEYDDDIPYSTKKIINSINSILDQKYGKLIKPEIGKNKTIDKYGVYKQTKDGDILIKSFDNIKDAISYRKELNKDRDNSFAAEYTHKGYTVNAGIQPTQTNETLKENIESVKNKLDSTKGDFLDILTTEEVVGFENKNGYLIVDYSGNILTEELSKKVFKTFEEAKKELEKFTNNIPRKEYTEQALINTKIAKLKEVAKKYPRSLIRSEVKSIFSVSSSFEYLEELPFQKIPTKTQPEEETLCQTPSLVSKNSIDIPFA